jgi:hypothetical protein
MSLNDMCNGFHKWREGTTTSPSGKHLGIYKALVNVRKYNILTTKEKQSATDISPDRETITCQCLQIQHLLMTLAVQHGHTYQRWRIVHNFLLEKFRVIHYWRNFESYTFMKPTGA